MGITMIIYFAVDIFTGGKSFAVLVALIAAKEMGVFKRER
jgi:hypothetical protein